MKAPQIILIAWLSFGLLVSAYYHGKPKEGKHSIWYSLLGTAIIIGLLIWGKYFI